MNPHEAHLLLGGYATGTLTEAERQALFAAALEDQSLFDALADEEALRELLADPAARAKLLAGLEPPKVRPFWRRPGALTLAASLVAAVGVGILMKHTKTPQLRELNEMPPPPQTHQAPAKVAPPEAAKAAPKVAPRMKKAEPAPAPAPKQPSEPPAAAAPVAAPAAPPPASEPGGVVGGVAAVVDQTMESKVASAPSAAAGNVAQLAKRRESPAPTWSFEGHGASRQLIVVWGPGSVSVILHAPEGDRELPPLEVTPEPEGRSRARFAAPETDAPMDLRWAHSSLRIWPPEKSPRKD